MKKLFFDLDDLLNVVNEITKPVTVNGTTIKVLKSDESKAIYNKLGRVLNPNQLIWVNGNPFEMSDWSREEINDFVGGCSISLALVNTDELTSLLEENYLIKDYSGRPKLLGTANRNWMIQEYNSRINLEVDYLELIDLRGDYTLV